MASRNICLVCCDPVKKVSRRKEKPDLLEEELCVYFFVKKFILRDIVEGRIFSNSADDESLVGDDEVDFEKYLKKGKSLGECVAFCSSCQDSVKQAKETYANLCQLLVQLSKFQSSLQRKLRRSFHEEKETRRTDRSLRSAIRRTLKEQLAVDYEVTLDSVKVEVQPETLFSEIVKTEPNEDDFIDEEFGLEDDECYVNLKEFVISPSKSQVGEDKEDVDVESKKSEPAAKRKSVKLKKQLNKNSARKSRNNDGDGTVPSTSIESETSSIPLVLRRGRRPTNKRNRVPVERRTCPTCGAVFSRRIAMKYHLNAVHEKKVAFYCDVDGCGQVFYLKEARNTHQKRHLSKEQIRHLILANKFDLVKLSEGTQFNLEETMEEIEGLESREYSEHIVDQVLNRTCPKCRNIYETPAIMNYHLKIHHKSDSSSDSRHVCEKCGKSYALISSYKNHIRFDHVEIVTTDGTNDGSEKPVRPFVCDIEGCDKSFSRPEYVKNHKNHFHRLGKNLGPFLCSFCGRELRTGSGLKRHILTHHTENAPRRFKCHMCEKSFLTSTLLKKHLMCKYHGGGGRPWRPSKWDPKYNLSRKKRVKAVPASMHQPVDSESLNNPEEGNNPGNKTASSQFNEPVWFRDQAEGISINTNSTVTTDLGMPKGLDCPSQIFQPPMLM